MQQTDLKEHTDNTLVQQSLEDEKPAKLGQDNADHGEDEDDRQGDEQQDAEVIAESSFWTRIRKIVFILVLVWLAMAMLRATSKPRSKVIYASRYSEDYKFRPAASPIIAEHLKDGRTRIRGAEPTARSIPPAKAKPKPKPRDRKSSKQKRIRSGK